jgi:sensor histidine kinase YesM
MTLFTGILPDSRDTTLVFTRLTRVELRKHLLNWLLFSIFVELFDPVHGNFWQIIQGVASFVIPCVLVYYSFSLFIFPNFNRRRSLLLFLSALLLYFLFVAWEFHVTREQLKSGTENIPFIFFDALIIFGLICIAAYSSYTNRRTREIIKEQDEKERYILGKELSSIESQFNSELTGDFLQFIQSEVKPHSADAAKAVELFEGIARYTFTTKADAPVPLSRELDYLDNYINLLKCLHTNTFVNLTGSGEIQDRTIYPRILINFIENAFKHGITNDVENPISVSLEVLPDRICFKVTNKKDKIKKTTVSGVGRTNAKEVLDLFYKGKYELNVSESPDGYATSLILMTNSESSRL